MPINNPDLSKEVRGRLRQFYRILLSYSDFKQAKFSASYIIEEKLHNDEDQRLLESLNCAMIVSYCRPFSGNDKGASVKIPDLAQSFLKDVPDNELEIHKIVMEDRNTFLAHTDSVAAEIEPVVWNIQGIKMLMPAQNDRLAPLTIDATKTFYSLANRMFDKVINERHRLEPEFMSYFKENPIFLNTNT